MSHGWQAPEKTLPVSPAPVGDDGRRAPAALDSPPVERNGHGGVAREGGREIVVEAGLVSGDDHEVSHALRFG